jgi:hypothetical protein
MALELQVHVHDMLGSLGMMRRLPSQRFRDCDDVVRALHRDGRTSQNPSSDKLPRTAIPIAQQLVAVDVKVQPW